MPIIARDNRKDFTPAPEGLHQAVCCDVIDLGICETNWGDKHQVEIRWQLEVTNEENGKPFMVLKRYTLSLHEKAALRQHLEAWRSRKFTAEELEGFDLEKLVGVNCQIQVVHNVSDDGRRYGNVQAIVPLGRGMTKMRVRDYVRVVDREDAKHDGGVVEEAEEEVPF
jgi:hypothetical protein